MIRKKMNEWRQIANYPLFMPDTTAELRGLRAYLYCRVASDDNYALDLQQNNLRQYAKEAGLKVVGIASEYANGFNMNRSALNEIRQIVITGKTDIVLVQNGSRISHNSQNLGEFIEFLHKYGVILYCVQEQAVIRLAG